MNQQFQTRFLLEDYDEFESLKSALLQAGASEDVAEMLTNAAAEGHIEPSKAIEIVKSTTGLSEDGVGGGSTTGGGVTNGAAFTAGAGEQMTGRKRAFKEDAPMLAHGKADISTYTQDNFKKVEGHAKLKGIEPKDLWGTLPTAMSEELDEIITHKTKEKLKSVLSVVKEKSPKIYDYILDLISDIYPHDEEVEALVAKTGLQENYHRFKRETRERPKQDQYHQAIKEVNRKLDEVNRILEFTSRMKEELSEGDEILEVKARTAKTMDKLKTKIAEAYQKLKKLN
jgi:hypothetical protein